MTFMQLWIWLSEHENPVTKFGWLPVLFWIIWGSMTICGFIPTEWLGVLRIKGMVPLTWIIRCAPRLAMIAFIAVAIWHFVFVTTKVN